jgi:hypothetical protein
MLAALCAFSPDRERSIIGEGFLLSRLRNNRTFSTHLGNALAAAPTFLRPRLTTDYVPLIDEPTLVAEE